MLMPGIFCEAKPAMPLPTAKNASAHGAGGEGELERLGLCRSAAEGGQGNDESCQCTLEHDDPPEKRGLT